MGEHLRGGATTQAFAAQRAVRDAGRWFAGYLTALGVVAAAWIVTIEAVFPDGVARAAAGGVCALAFGALMTWADSRDVQPRGARRRVLVASAVWFGAYLLVIGPLVRWQAGTSLGWWALASLVLASPFFLSAALARHRA